MLTLGIRYLTGCAVASDVDNRSRVEWPPHPGRVFMALAAAHFQTGEDPAERAALEWLEQQTAPQIKAAAYTERAAVTQFVPVNDAAASAGTAQNRLIEGDVGKELAKANSGAGGTYVVSIAGQTFERAVKLGRPVNETLGLITLAPGDHEVRVAAKEVSGAELFRLRRLELTPIVDPASDAKPAAESLVERDARTAWWREARFGMFIHWDMSSLAGTEISWSRQGSRPLDNGSDPAGYVADPAYDNLYKKLNPTNFNAQAWVRLAKAAGMKYLVFTAKHHGGFCMWDTKLTDYSIMNTSFRRDVVKELADACHAAGLKFGIYYSQRDWHQPDYGIGDNQRYLSYMNGQLRELLTNYGPVDILWFDSYGRGDPLTFWRIPETWSLIKTLQPQVLINNRLAALRATNNPAEFRGDFDTPEQKLGSYKDTRLWESCITIITVKHGGWSYRPDGKIKTSEEALRMLVSCATGDGNLLLDVGPDSSGVIPDDQAAPLLAMGKWLEANGESIYGTRGGPFKPWSNGGSTRKGNTVYIHVLSWPDDSLKLPPLPVKVTSSRMLGGGKAEIKQSAAGIIIAVLEKDRQPMDTVIALEMEGDVMKLPAIAVPPQLDAGKLKTTAATGAETGSKH